jgi:hypothetical protein
MAWGCAARLQAVRDCQHRYGASSGPWGGGDKLMKCKRVPTDEPRPAKVGTTGCKSVPVKAAGLLMLRQSGQPRWDLPNCCARDCIGSAVLLGLQLDATASSGS